MLQRIKDLVCQIAGCKRTTEVAKPVTAEPQMAVVTPLPHCEEMHPTNQTASVGGEDYPVYHQNGSRNLPHVLVGATYVPLSIFKKAGAVDCGTF